MKNFEEEFIRRMEPAKSNIPEHQNGAVIYEKFVKPARVDLAKVMAHFAGTSLFSPYENENKIYSQIINL